MVVIASELRQNRNLIKPNFDGYKLSLDNVPVISQECLVAPLHAKPSDEQFSFLHAELFSLHNHLVKDLWDEGTCYYVGVGGEIVRCKYDEVHGSPLEQEEVFRIDLSDHEEGDYNVSMFFVSEVFCVICNGRDELFIVRTSERRKSRPKWKEYEKVKIDSQYENFILRDARLEALGDKSQINLILQNVGSAEGTFVTRLLWCTFTFSENTSSSFKISDELSGKGSVNYCAFDPKVKGIVISCHKDFTFHSQRSEEEPADEAEPPKQEDATPYTWNQTGDDITVKFNCTHSKELEDYHVICREQSILVKCKDNVMLEGDLYEKIDADLTTWTLENDFVQITLIKKDANAPKWPIFVSGGPQETVESDVNTNIPVPSESISNLESQNEECDLEPGNPEDEYFIERLSFETRVASHKILLGSHPILFSTPLGPGFPPAIATRQDVDACIWLQVSKGDNARDWCLDHEGNLHAFGYVQASKQQKKFMDCSPDLNFAVISESHRHIFIYKSNYGGQNVLRNRSGPQTEVGKQQLVVLENKGEILGMKAENFVTTLLTEKYVLYLQMNC